MDNHSERIEDTDQRRNGFALDPKLLAEQLRGHHGHHDSVTIATVHNKAHMVNQQQANQFINLIQQEYRIVNTNCS